MDPWYESSGPSEIEVQSSMKNSHIYICLYKESNTPEENKALCQIASSALSIERERKFPLEERFKNDTFNLTNLTYDSIRQNPNWEELTQNILKEEVISHKPYGSWRGFSTFVIGPLREKFITRLIREVWAPQVIHNKFAPIWLEHNYSPDNQVCQGYERAKEHYYANS